MDLDASAMLASETDLFIHTMEPELPTYCTLGDVDMSGPSTGADSLPLENAYSEFVDLGMGELFGAGSADYRDSTLLLQAEASHGDAQPPRDSITESTCTHETQLRARTSPSHSTGPLPTFIRPLPQGMDKDDVEYLQMKGALELPSPALLSALLHCFSEYVYPFMPVLNLHDLLEATTRRNNANSSRGISLLLFQAVMSTSIGFVDDELLKMAGFQTRKEARRVYFQRTRLLYDFDYETDRITVIQALLLMTHWHEDLDDEKGPSHWMGLAISLAYRSGIHRSYGPALTKEEGLRRRIWWSLYMRDCSISLGFRRPLRIEAKDYDVPMLEKGDFEIQAISGAARGIYGQSSMLSNEETQSELVEMCISMAKLSVCVRQVLETQYSAQTRRPTLMSGTTQSVTALHPIQDMETTGVDAIEQELKAWLESLPLCCHGQSPDLPSGNADGASVTAIHRIQLLMMYYTTVIALHRPQAQSSARPTAVAQLRRELSQAKVLDAARHVAEMAADLERQRLPRFLPAASVTPLLATMMVHLVEMRSNPAPPARELAARHLVACIRVLDRLRDLYHAADKAAQIVQAALNGAVFDIKPAKSIGASKV